MKFITFFLLLSTSLNFSNNILLNQKNIVIEQNDISNFRIEKSNNPNDSIDKFLEFFSAYVSEDKLKFLDKSLNFYSTTETDTAMSFFYHNYLTKIFETINKVFYELNVLEQYENGDYELYDYWTSTVQEYVPFIYFSFENSIEGPSAYINYSTLMKKAKYTKGKADDAFFKSLLTCYGPINSLYDNFTFYYVDNRGYLSLGFNYHYNALKDVIAADTISTLFKNSLDLLAQKILDIANDNYFAATKEMVYNEIELIQGLQNSTRFDLSNTTKLKIFLDTTKSEVYYDCLNQDCPE